MIILNFGITKILEKDKNDKHKGIRKYPTLKCIFYNKIFPKTPGNIIIKNSKLNKNISSDSYRKQIYNNNFIVDENKYKKNNILNMKRNNYNTKENENKQDYIVVNYLNNKCNCNLTALDGKLNNKMNNNYIKKIDNQNLITNSKNNYLKISDKFKKENHSLILSKYINNYSEKNLSLNEQGIDNNSIIKHSFSFLKERKNKNEYINIINGYKKSTFNK